MPRRERRCSPTALRVVPRRRSSKRWGYARLAARCSTISMSSPRRRHGRVWGSPDAVNSQFPAPQLPTLEVGPFGSWDLTRVLIAGLSTRAAADSAVAAGVAVTAVDALGDLDVHPSVRAVSLPRHVGVALSANAAARVAEGLPAETAVYLATFASEPDAVRALAAGRTLWGSPPDVLRRVRDPWLVMMAFHEHGIPAPAIRLKANESNDPNDP